jgi:protein SCO1/2
VSNNQPRLILTSAMLSLALAVWLAVAWINRSEPAPLIQGVLLPDAKPVDVFQLTDHQGHTFSNADLLGAWHLLSYGFTTCPDICPTTLFTLDALVQQLTDAGHEPPRVLFYTVDHRRDSAAVLADYVPWFNPQFLGLTHGDHPDNPHLPFEHSLGIVAQISLSPAALKDPTATDYQVSHGVNLILLNPDGKLQAVFKPGLDEHGNPVFDARQLSRDYLAVRQHTQTPTLVAAALSNSSFR